MSGSWGRVRLVTGSVLILVSLGWTGLLFYHRPRYGPTYYGPQADLSVGLWQMLAQVTLPVALVLLLAGAWLIRSGYRRVSGRSRNGVK